MARVWLRISKYLTFIKISELSTMDQQEQHHVPFQHLQRFVVEVLH